MARDEFLKRFTNKKTCDKYIVIFRRFDRFLEQRKQTEQEFIAGLNQSEIHIRYNTLQELTFYLQGFLSDRSVRNYFDSIFKYLLWCGCELDYTQRKIRVQFPRISRPIPAGLDREKIKRLLGFADQRMSLFIMVLAGAGLREAEGLQLQPRHIVFENTANSQPALVNVVPEIAKFNLGRETFLPAGTAAMLKQYIAEKNIRADGTIFCDAFKPGTVSLFDYYFSMLRRKAGLELAGRAARQHNDIKLHSLRAWFITTWTELGRQSFGHALAGHSKDRSVYYRLSKDDRIKAFAEHQKLFEFA